MCLLFYISSIRYTSLKTTWLKRIMKTAAGISILLGQYNEMEIAYHSPASPTNTTKRKENTTFNTTTQWRILPRMWPFLSCFWRQNWRVIFEVFQSNFSFAWLNSTTGSLVWENEWINWEMFTSSLRSDNFKSVNISGKIRHCAYVLCWPNPFID